jgi:hypothetical protein
MISSRYKLELLSCLGIPISLVKYHCLQILLCLIDLAPIELQLSIERRKWMLCFVPCEHLFVLMPQKFMWMISYSALRNGLDKATKFHLLLQSA